MSNHQGKVVVITGMSATGKSTVINALLRKHPEWRTVSSYTTRARRIAENDQKKYQFIDRATFDSLVTTGEIIEFEEYSGNLYGTSRHSLDSALATAPVVLLDLQIAGARFVQQQYPAAIVIFIFADPDVIRQRLLTDPHRQATSQAEVDERLAAISRLDKERHTFAYQVESKQGEVAAAITAVEKIITAKQ